MAYYEKGKKIDILEMPIFLWDKSYEDPECMKMAIQHISDYMLYRSGNVFSDPRNPNRPINYDIYEGNIGHTEIKKMYEDTIYTWGAPGAAKMKDYNFFHKNFKYIEGLMIDMPFGVKAHNISQAYVDDKIYKNAELGAAFVRNSVADMLTNLEGQDFSSLKNEDIPVPKTEDELLSKMNAPQQLEYTMSALLKNLNYRHNLNDIFTRSNFDKFCVNAEFCYIDTDEREPVIKYARPAEVGWISPVPVEHLDDENIMAWSVNKYISLENALRKYSFELATDKKADELKETIQKLRSGGSGLYYDPTEANVLPYLLTTTNSADVPDQIGAASWQSYFYNANGDTYEKWGTNYALLDQKGYFKMIKFLKFKLLVNGKNPTEEQVKRWRSKVNSKDEVYKYIPVEDEYKGKASEFLVRAPKEELWEYTRLGHCVILNVRRYQYQTRYEKDINKCYSPVIGRISSMKSFISLGTELWQMYNKFMYKADELVTLAGADEIVWIDEAQISMSIKQLMHFAKSTGFGTYNSTLRQDKSNSDANKHLTKSSLSPGIDKILNYYAAANTCQQLFDKMAGFIQQSFGESSPYQGLGEINTLLKQAGVLLKGYFRQDYLFRKNAIQRYADICKMYYGRENKDISVFWGKGKKEILRLTKEMGMFDYEIYLDPGIDEQMDKQYLISMGERALSSGNMSVQDLMSIFYSENSQERMSILNKGLDQLEEEKLKIQQQANQIAQQANQINQQAKIGVPIQVAQIKATTDKYQADLRYNDSRQKANEKGDLADIEAQKQMEQSTAQHILDEDAAQSDMNREIVMENGVMT